MLILQDFKFNTGKIDTKKFHGRVFKFNIYFQTMSLILNLHGRNKASLKTDFSFLLNL